MMIDLGVLEAGAQEAHLRRRRGPGQRRSRLGAVLLVLACCLTIVAETGPDSSILRPLPALPFDPGGQYAVDGGLAFLAQSATSGNRITGYRLADGARRWTTTVADLATLVSLQPAAGVLVVTLYAAGEDADHTVVLDETDGRVLWRDRYPVDTLLPAGRVLLVHAYPVAGDPADATAAFATTVEAVDLHTGATMWSYRLPPGCQHATTGDLGTGTRLAVLCPGGTLRALDLRSGRTLRARRVAPLDAGAVDIGPVLSTSGERLLIGYEENGASRLTAYDSTSLRQLWAISGAGTYGVYPCAQVLCLSDERGLTVLDPATGRERWRTSRHVSVAVPGGGPAVDLPAGLADDLLAQPLGESGTVVVSADTGRRLLDLGGWQSVTGATRPALFARWSDPPGGRVWFGVLGHGPLAVRTVGAAQDVLRGQCRAWDTYVTCTTFNGQLRVWRYQP